MFFFSTSELSRSNEIEVFREQKKSTAIVLLPAMFCNLFNLTYVPHDFAEKAFLNQLKLKISPTLPTTPSHTLPLLISKKWKKTS